MELRQRTVSLGDHHRTGLVPLIYTLGVLGLSAAAVAVVSGLLLALTEPAVGSTGEAALGVAAALGGISSGVLIGGAAVLAQVFGLWSQVPAPVRTTATVVLIVIVVTALAPPSF
jgi:hypothetical protein